MKFHEISWDERQIMKIIMLKFHDFSCSWPPKSWNLMVYDPFFIVTTNGARYYSIFTFLVVFWSFWWMFPKYHEISRFVLIWYKNHPIIWTNTKFWHCKFHGFHGPWNHGNHENVMIFMVLDMSNVHWGVKIFVVPL